MPANLTDKDIIDMINHINYLKQEVEIRDRALVRLKFEYEQFKMRRKDGSRNNI